MSATRRPPEKRSLPARENLFEYTTLFEFSNVINQSLDLRFILGHVLLTIMGKMLATKGMALLTHGSSVFRIEMVKGFPRELETKELPAGRLSHTLCSLERLSTARHPWAPYLKEQGVSIVLPLCIANQPIGMLAFGPRMNRKPLQARELTYFRSLANLAATAIEKTHMIDELQVVNRKLDRKISEMNTLFDLGKEFGTLLDPDKLVRLLVFSLMGQVGVQRYMICLREGSDLRSVAARLDGPLPQPELLSVLSGARAATTVEEFVVRQKVDPRETLRALGLAVIVPMRLQGKTRGLVLIGEKLSREPFTHDDLEFLTSLGNLAIISLENARLFHEAIEKQRLEDELLIAREIQKGLLPSILPEIPRLQIAASNISSRQVGGDYYDVIPVDEGRHVIAIGDVSGKGTPAALLMANLQAFIRALVPLQLSLSELTGRVNDLLCQNTGGNKFVTFFWGMLDHRQMTLTYVNAGHNYPFLLRAGGAVERLESGGMILGVIPTTVPYQEATVALDAGDLLLLFTDGVSEAMNKDSKEYGEERLERVLRGCPGWSAEEVIAAVRDDITAHTQGAPQSDDITMMVIAFR